MEVNSKGPTTCYGAPSWEGISVGAVEAGLLEEVSSKGSGGSMWAKIQSGVDKQHHLVDVKGTL